MMMMIHLHPQTFLSIVSIWPRRFLLSLHATWWMVLAICRSFVMFHAIQRIPTILCHCTRLILHLTTLPFRSRPQTHIHWTSFLSIICRPCYRVSRRTCIHMTSCPLCSNSRSDILHALGRMRKSCFTKNWLHHAHPTLACNSSYSIENSFFPIYVPVFFTASSNETSVCQNTKSALPTFTTKGELDDDWQRT